MCEPSLANVFKKSIFPNKGKESEKKTEIYLIERTRALGGQSYKWASPNNRGVPDRICVFPFNTVFFVEVKSEEKTLSKLQQLIHKRLKRVINHIYTVSTKAEVDSLFDQLQKEGVI